jgi:hypothetical protein
MQIKEQVFSKYLFSKHLEEFQQTSGLKKIKDQLKKQQKNT